MRASMPDAPDSVFCSVGRGLPKDSKRTARRGMPGSGSESEAWAWPGGARRQHGGYREREHAATGRTLQSWIVRSGAAAVDNRWQWAGVPSFGGTCDQVRRYAFIWSPLHRTPRRTTLRPARRRPRPGYLRALRFSSSVSRNSLPAISATSSTLPAKAISRSTASGSPPTGPAAFTARRFSAA